MYIQDEMFWVKHKNILTHICALKIQDFKSEFNFKVTNANPTGHKCAVRINIYLMETRHE